MASELKFKVEMEIGGRLHPWRPSARNIIKLQVGTVDLVLLLTDNLLAEIDIT